MRETLINGRWTLMLPEHRAARPEWESGWEVARLDSMAKNIRPFDVVYEAGTEEGDLSALFARWSGGIVLAEPNPKAWPNVRAIFDANKLTNKVITTWVGFFADTTEIQPAGSAVAQTIGGWPECAYGEIIGDHGFSQLCQCPDIPRITIDDMKTRTGAIPSVITLDVEGSELRVLAGASWTLALHRPLIYVSVHDTFMRDMYGENKTDLWAFMDEHGYSGFHLGTDHEEHILFYPKEYTLKNGVVER